MLFLAYGFSRNYILPWIYLQDSKSDIAPLSLTMVIDDNNLNQINKFNEWFIYLDKFIFNELTPRWFFIKDPGTAHISRTSTAILAQDAVFIEPDPLIFENVLIYLLFIPGYILLFCQAFIGCDMFINPNTQEFWFIIQTILQDLTSFSNYGNELNIFQYSTPGEFTIGTAEAEDIRYPATIEYLNLFNPWKTHMKYIVI